MVRGLWPLLIEQINSPNTLRTQNTMTHDTTNPSDWKQPDGLSAAQIAYWNDAVAAMPSNARRADRHLLEALVSWWGLFIEAARDANSEESRYKSSCVMASASKNVMCISAKLGLNPTDRHRLSEKFEDLYDDDEI